MSETPGRTDWLALGDALGPLPAPYHPRDFRFPRPAPPPCAGEIEYSDGTFRRLADIRNVTICGDPRWRERRYVRGGEEFYDGCPTTRAVGPLGATEGAKMTTDTPPASTAAPRALTFDFACDAPPSVNNLYRNVPGRGRVTTREYAAWRDLAALQAGVLPWYGEDRRNRYRWEITVAAHALPHTRDLDNLLKPLIDLVTRLTGLRDAYCEVVRAFRSGEDAGKPRATVTVEVWPFA